MSYRLVHISDLHLGFRAFPGRDRGWNLRERDLATAFQRAIQEAARLSPRMVLLTGDLFHRPDPPSTAFLSLTRGIRTLQSMVPGVTILAIAGERDTPLSPADPGPVAVLDALPGVEAAAGAPRAVRFRREGVHALLAPYRAVQGPAQPELRPDPDARFNILLLRTRPGPSPLQVEVDPDEWDYVAVGGRHTPWELAANVRCPGALERVGWDPWAEDTEEKGFVSFDLETGVGEFHPTPTRPVVDLAPVRVDPAALEEGTRRLRHLVDEVPGGVIGKLLRVRLQGGGAFPEAGVDPGFMEGLRRKAGHLEVLRVQLDMDQGGKVQELEAGPPGPSMLEPFVSGGIDGSLTLDPGIHLAIPSGEGRAGGLRHRLVELLELHPPTDEGAQSLNPEGLNPGRAMRGGGSSRELLAIMAQLLTRSAGAVNQDTVEGGGSQSVPLEAETPDRGTASRMGGAETGTDGEPTRQGLELELRELRGDAVEAEGDAEARALEWARDRQEAETRLQSYRDRARELRARLRTLDDSEAPCPTCGDLLTEERREELRRSLTDEWEMVVQDGKWWKRRRDQLEERPAELRELESRALRLRSRAEEVVGLLKEKVVSGGGRKDDGARPGLGSPGTQGVSPSDAGPEWPGGDRLGGSLQAALEPFLLRAGTRLRRWSEGRLSGVAATGRGEPRVREGREWRVPTPSEEPVLSLVLQLTLWELARSQRLPVPRGMVLSGLDGRGVDPLLPLLGELPLDTLTLLVVAPFGSPIPGDPRIRSVILEEEGRARSGMRQVVREGVRLRLSVSAAEPTTSGRSDR